MMSIEYIRSLTAEQAKRAKRAQLQPTVFYDRKDIAERLSKIANMGDYRATRHGWKLAEHRLCDSSGMGAPNEPALTRSQLVDWIGSHLADNVTNGFAIIEVGQFQVVVGRFTRPHAKAGAS